MKKSIQFRLNGGPVSLEIEEDRALVWVLRKDLELTGTKIGCGAGLCGSCTVLVDGEPIRSCITSTAEIEGKDVVTIEGLAGNGELHPLQKAFIDHGAYQCGFCTPGMIMNATGLVEKKKALSRDSIIEAMEQNLCRCGAHQRIIAAIEDASRQMGGES